MAAIGIRPGEETVREFRWTIDRVIAAMEAGVFPPGENFELFEGRLVLKMPQSELHAAIHFRFFSALRTAFGSTHDGHTEHPIRLADDSEPEPDITIVRGRAEDLGFRKASPAEIALVMEISQTSLAFDLGDKRSAYARSLIPEYWVLNIPGRTLHVHVDPDGRGMYRTETVLRGEAIVPRLNVPLSTLLPPTGA